MQTGQETYSLSVPVATQGGQDYTIRLRPDPMGRYQAERHVHAQWNGQRRLPEAVNQSERRFESVQAALDFYDRWVSKRIIRNCMNLIRNNMNWQSKPATEAQMQFLRRLKVYIPPEPRTHARPCRTPHHRGQGQTKSSLTIEGLPTHPPRYGGEIDRPYNLK